VGDETYDPRDQNLARAIDAVRSASSRGADLVVFGEMYLTGYRTDEWLHRWATSVDPPDRHVDVLVAAATDEGVHILIGAATRGGFVPGEVYNSAILVGPEGVLGVYRKTHLATYWGGDAAIAEGAFTARGGELPVFDTPIGRIGVHICYDIAFPEVARVQALNGADFLVNVSASVAGYEEIWDRLLYARAFENATWYVVCSVVGEQRGQRFFGGSRVIDPSGRVAATSKPDTEGIVVADLDLGAARKARSLLHGFSTRRPDLYAAITEPPAYP
jgi:5-aminopentanamidase